MVVTSVRMSPVDPEREDSGKPRRVSEPAVRKEISRLRQRYREFFRKEIIHTLSSPDEVDEEMRHLFAVICR